MRGRGTFQVYLHVAMLVAGFTVRCEMQVSEKKKEKNCLVYLKEEKLEIM